MSKQVVDKIIAAIINEDNSSTISAQAIKSLLELKDNENRQLFTFTVDDNKKIIIDDQSRRNIDEIIKELTISINDLIYESNNVSEQIKRDREDLKEGFWAPDEIEELEEEIRHQQELLNASIEMISKIKEAIEVFQEIKENHIYLPQKNDVRFLTTMGADALRKDLAAFEKSNKAPFRKGIHEVLLEDFTMLEQTIRSSITDDGTLVLKSATYGNGIHQIDKDLFYKDKANNIRLYFMRTAEKNNIAITILAMMDGHVGGKTEDSEYRKKIVSERQKCWARELAVNPKMANLDESYQEFKALLRKKIFEKKSPTIDVLAQTVHDEIVKRKAEVKVS